VKRPGFLPLRVAPVRLAERLPAILPIALPLVVAVAMALIFRHPAMLMFGLMGPLIALSGSWNKKREQARQKQQQQEQERDLEHQRQVDTAHKTQAWRAEQVHAHPAVTDWLRNPLWRAEANSPEVTVRLGVGVATPPPTSGVNQPVSGVPLTIPLHTSLAVVGSGIDAVAAWRAVACQALAILSAPGRTASSGVTVSGVWTRNADVPPHLDIPHPAGEHLNRWCFVDSATQVPPQATWVLVVASNKVARLFHRGVVTHDELQPDVLTFAESRWVRARLVEADGTSVAPVPDIQASDRGALWAELATDQPAIDLVAQGPHTLVWGKTGSGKSVLLQRLVASLCARYSPDQFALVGIDFKGGATLAPLMAHPHAAGLLTDLSPSSTTRVTASLRAEILRREQLFADYRVASWPDLPADASCPRVLVVVDEAGVVALEAPELMAVLSDIASRGRSLGLHLVVSTQRPQHVPRNIIANCALRLCLGVTDADEASQYAPDIPRHLLHTLRHSPPGTVVIPDSTGSYTLAAVDTSHPEVSWPGQATYPLWCDELPEHLALENIAETEQQPGAGYLVGLADYPDRQTQEAWVYRPPLHGPLVIAGESGSGHTTCLTHLADQATSRGVEVVWASAVLSVLAWQLMGLRDSSDHAAPRLFLADRLDRALQGASPEGLAWILDAFEALAVGLSERGDGSGAVITTAPGGNVATALSRWNATSCLLRHRDPTLWALAGGPPSMHDPTAPPGRAVVGGLAMQWCYPEHTTEQARPEVQVGSLSEGVFLIAPGHRHGSGGDVLSPAEAEGKWQEIKQAIDQGPGVVCSDILPQQMRQWCGPGHTTPPVAAAWPYGWHLHPGGVTLVTCEAQDPLL
jgi:S-DNA-T family DNA segregation ATPase FtsK/SpoIIIE